MRGPIVTRYIQQILLETAWGKLDYLILDMPPGTGDVQLTITQTLQLNGAVIVTTPQTLSLIDVARGILMFEKMHVPILGIVENMAYFECDSCHTKHHIFGPQDEQSLKKRFGVETLVSLPLLKQMIRTVDENNSPPQIKEGVDRTLQALTNLSHEKKDLPEVRFDQKNIFLKWKDGREINVSHRDVRLNCRCALCINELTGEKILNPDKIRMDIAPTQIFPLGNYALAINWNDRHTSGIYSYELIESLAQK
jgi:ATP-binding protein involved in chromosome partitioning